MNYYRLYLRESGSASELSDKEEEELVPTEIPIKITNIKKNSCFLVPNSEMVGKVFRNEEEIYCELEKVATNKKKEKQMQKANII